jgi:hypothetical protein
MGMGKEREGRKEYLLELRELREYRMEEVWNRLKRLIIMINILEFHLFVFGDLEKL